MELGGRGLPVLSCSHCACRIQISVTDSVVCSLGEQVRGVGYIQQCLAKSQHLISHLLLPLLCARQVLAT